MTDKQIISFCNSYLLLLLTTMMMVGCASPSPALECTNGSLVKVPAKPQDWIADVLTPTAIQVEDGNTISFSAFGTWDVGLGPTGPDGQHDWCECTVSERSGAGFRGPVGALIGRIGGQGEPFLIGSKKTITAVGSGTLFLGSNDNLGPCDKVSRGSCYDDNRGNMEVCVEVN